MKRERRHLRCAVLDLYLGCDDSCAFLTPFQAYSQAAASAWFNQTYDAVQVACRRWLIQSLGQGDQSMEERFASLARQKRPRTWNC